MGWWRIIDTGEHLVTGDGPADIFGPAAEKVVKLYEKTYGRKPKRREMIATLNFVMGGLELEE